uniref:Uncharacterized protein n=1 Tax=Arion vulgaris TaxID=1028688 RepID=A0A0B6ZHR2_9EUPU
MVVEKRFPTPPMFGPPPDNPELAPNPAVDFVRPNIPLPKLDELKPVCVLPTSPVIGGP